MQSTAALGGMVSTSVHMVAGEDYLSSWLAHGNYYQPGHTPATAQGNISRVSSVHSAFLGSSRRSSAHAEDQHVRRASAAEEEGMVPRSRAGQQRPRAVRFDAPSDPGSPTTNAHQPRLGVRQRSAEVQGSVTSLSSLQSSAQWIDSMAGSSRAGSLSSVVPRVASVSLVAASGWLPRKVARAAMFGVGSRTHSLTGMRQHSELTLYGPRGPLHATPRYHTTK